MLSPPRGVKLKYHSKFCYVDQKRDQKKKDMPIFKKKKKKANIILDYDLLFDHNNLFLHLNCSVWYRITVIG